MKLNYLQAGGDLRYAVVNGIANPRLPNVSLGVGFNYLKGGIGATMDTAQDITFGINERIHLGNADVNLEWNSLVLDLKAQISKTFAIVTPYLGVGGNYAWSSAGYSVNADVTWNGRLIGPEDIAAINSTLRQYGFDEVDVTTEGISSILKRNDFSVRAFGGLSLNLAAFRLDLTGLYSFMDSNFGGSVGLRFQL